MGALQDKNKREHSECVLLMPDEMSGADRKAIAWGASGFDFMEAAGRAVAEAIWSRRSACPVSVLCGPGNNGGDGFAAARHLAALGWPVRLALLGSPGALSGDAARHAGLWKGSVERFAPDILDGAGVVVDAIFGAGLSRPVEGAAGKMIEALKDRKIATWAVDVPSGVDGATGEVRGAAAPAEVTVTFFRKKPGHVLFPGRSLCGTIVLADIGIPALVLEDMTPKTFENAPGSSVVSLHRHEVRQGWLSYRRSKRCIGQSSPFPNETARTRQVLPRAKIVAFISCGIYLRLKLQIMSPYR